jgi:hypothetical protein
MITSCVLLAVATTVTPATVLAGGTSPNAMVTRLNHTVLASNPDGMSLTLPGVARPLQVLKVPGMQASIGGGPSADRPKDDVWVGEVMGQQPAMSVVTLLTQDDSVYGSVR